MAFKLYTDKSSVLRKNSRYVQGGTSDLTPNAVNWWEKREDIPSDQYDDITFIISKANEFRPDLISYQVYGRPDLAWLVLQYNEIVDINEQFVVGRTILLPSPIRAFTDILTSSLPTIPT